MHLALPGGSSSNEEKAVIVRDSGEDKELTLHLADKNEYIKQDERARQWHELDEEQKKLWKRRLSDAGHWAVDEGEAVLKGVLFSSWAGLVGRVAGEAIREL